METVDEQLTEIQIKSKQDEQGKTSATQINLVALQKTANDRAQRASPKAADPQNARTIIESLQALSHSVPMPSVKLLPSGLGGIHFGEEQHLEEFIMGQPHLFSRPIPLIGIRSAVEVEHRGLAEGCYYNSREMNRARKVQYEAAEKRRRQQREYYELLLRELSYSGESLGKRREHSASPSVFGVPDLGCSVKELRAKAEQKQLGNYATNSEVPRRRIKALADPSLFDGKSVLELGCGDGSFLIELARKYKPIYLKGVDADSNLIELAAKSTRTDQEQQEDAFAPSSMSWIPLCFRHRGKTMSLTLNRSTEFLSPSVSTEKKKLAPVNFELENIIEDITKYRGRQFDTLICLSVVKWVHLNWGDQGLMRLLLKFYNSLKVGGVLILDIHTWKSYKKKKNLCQTFKYNFSTLGIKPRHILERLLKLGFELDRTIEHGYETELKRPIFILKKVS